MKTEENDAKKHAEAMASFPFDDDDRVLLERYSVIAEGIACNFGSACEVVVHSLEDMSSSIVKIVNGHVTGRSVGSPITDLALEVLKKSIETREDLVGPYFSRTDGGRPLKSTTMLIRNGKDVPIGFLCINFDLSVPLSEVLRTFGDNSEPSRGQGEHFTTDIHALVRHAIDEERETLARSGDVSQVERNRRIALELERRGVFGIKGAVETAARELGVTKFTIYKYLRELRSDTE